MTEVKKDNTQQEICLHIGHCRVIDFKQFNLLKTIHFLLVLKDTGIVFLESSVEYHWGNQVTHKNERREVLKTHDRTLPRYISSRKRTPKSKI